MEKNKIDEQIGYKKPPKDNPTKFKPGQNGGATGAQKSAGRDRRKQAQIIMDKMLVYGNMTVEEIKAEITSKGEKMTVQDYLITKYVLAGTKSEKMLVDRMDRHISKAPTQNEVTGKDGEPLQQNVHIYLPDNKRDNAGRDETD